MIASILALVLVALQAGVAEPIDSVTLVPETGTSLSMGRGSYEGELQISAHPAGLAAVETTTVDRYLLGITEVPSSWPDGSKGSGAPSANAAVKRLCAASRAT